MDLVKGQHALVTGGGTGIGFGIARRLLEEGAANVVIAGRREDVLVDAVERLQALVDAAPVTHQVCDITVEDDVAAAVEAACNTDGELDILVANAGSGFPGPMIESSADAWRFCCELNVVGTAMCLKHAGQAMKTSGGSIVTISSSSGAYHDLWMAPYGATKAALDHMTRSTALEYARFDIRVNSVAPGYVETEVTSSVMPEDIRADCIARTPLGRSGAPEELGDTVAFLCSPLARWITGQVIGVDGGLTIPVGTDFAELAERIAGEGTMRRATT